MDFQGYELDKIKRLEVSYGMSINFPHFAGILGSCYASLLLVLLGLRDLIENVLHHYRGPPPLYVHWSDLLDLPIIHLQRDRATEGNSR